jgi:glycine betaine transporter
MYSEKGTLDPTNKTKIVWGVLMAALAAAMMLGNGDGLSMLQTLSIVAAFPFAFIMVAAMVALVRALKKERDEK